jgi:hypothetical protein
MKSLLKYLRILSLTIYSLGLALGLECGLEFGFISQVWAAPVSFQTSKDFRGLIVEGERPEIVACMTATRRFFKNSTEYEDYRWPSNPSQSAILNEKEVNGRLNRTITMRAQVLPNVEALFKSWLPVQVRCQQVNEGYPEVSVIVLSGTR